MPLPKRPAPYVLAVLLVVLIALVMWIYQAVTSASRFPQISQAPAAESRQPGVPAKAATLLSPGPGSSSPMPPVAKIDPGIQAMADELHKPDSSPQRDLEIISQLLTEYSRAFGGNPIGSNSDITEAFLGGDETPAGRFFPRSHPAVKNGQIADRWGQPYWFHPNSGSQMEIRSAGPDKQLFTADDLVLNPSPPGLGATPASQPPP